MRLLLLAASLLSPAAPRQAMLEAQLPAASIPAIAHARDNTVCPYATAESEAVSMNENGWNGLRFMPFRVAAVMTNW